MINSREKLVLLERAWPTFLQSFERRGGGKGRKEGATVDALKVNRAFTGGFPWNHG